MKRTFRGIATSVTLSVTLSFSASSFAKSAPLTLGLEKARHYHGKSTGKTYIQADRFKRKSNANYYKNYVQSKTSYPVSVTHGKGFYFVTIGPISSASEVRKVAGKFTLHPMLATKKNNSVSEISQVAPDENTHPLIKAKHGEHAIKTVEAKQVLEAKPPADPQPLRMEAIQPVEKTLPFGFEEGTWIVSAGAGVEYPQFKSSMTVNNGSGASPPFDKDVYTTKSRPQNIIALSAGQRWERDNAWLPAVSASLSYQHLFAKNVGNKVIQYSDPSFTNYSSAWQVASDVLMALLKVNIYQHAHFSPYLLAGAGGAFNLASNYSENALSGVTPRTNPAFQSRSSLQPAYRIGAGIDYLFDDQIILSAEYQYQDIGSISSGHGLGSWSTQNLNLGRFRANGVLLNLTYLLDEAN